MWGNLKAWRERREQRKQARRIELEQRLKRQVDYLASRDGGENNRLMVNTPSLLSSGVISVKPR